MWGKASVAPPYRSPATNPEVYAPLNSEPIRLDLFTSQGGPNGAKSPTFSSSGGYNEASPRRLETLGSVVTVDDIHDNKNGWTHTSKAAPRWQEFRKAHAPSLSSQVD